jgi:hypothetical protein
MNNPLASLKGNRRVNRVIWRGNQKAGPLRVE